MKRSDFLRMSTLGAGAVLLPRNVYAAGIGTGTLSPYLSNPQPDSMWVSWWTNSNTQSFLDWGTDSNDLANTMTGAVQNLGTGYRYHSGQITGLQASTLYYYRVRTESQNSPIYRFKTAPAKGAKTGRIRVLVLGDNQIISGERRWEKLVARARIKLEELYGAPIEECVDLILNIGDQVDVGTLNHWRNLHFEYGKLITPNIPSMTTVGNHETYSGESNLTLYKSLFRYEQLTYQGIVSPGGDTYYANQVANILFIHTNSEVMPTASEGAGDVQKQWVQNIVNAAKVDNSVDFIVSLVHRPYQAEQYVGDISQWFRDQIMPILAQTEKHVLNIGAHHHLYSRGQTREWPIYHIINGATAWDQFWGQSTEVDFDDVQKTIAHWAWQVIDFDLASREMKVDCYAEANVRFSEAERWTTKAYNSRLVDTFSRKLGLAAPSLPQITNGTGGGPGQPNNLGLPYTLTSSAFSTTTAETLNSTQFQIALDAGFTNLRVDRIRDGVNLYGDSGAPLYEPVNVNASVNILNYIIAANALPSTTFFSRVRHRDTNAMWSAWSAPYQFTVTNSATAQPALTLQKRVFPLGEDIIIGYERVAAAKADWIGIYAAGTSPTSALPISRQYVMNAAGTRKFAYDFPEGEYFAGLFSDNTTTELAPRVRFYVGALATLTLSEDAYSEGAAAQVTWSGAPGNLPDQISIYRVGESPGGSTPPAAAITARTVKGSRMISLPNGYYYAVLLINGGTFELSNRMPFSVGSVISQVSMAVNSVAQGQNFIVDFSGGPGIPKDWIGLFAAGSVPGIDLLIQYKYFAGATAGSVTFDPPSLDVGAYFVAMFTNDSYTEVSNRFPFNIVAP